MRKAIATKQSRSDRAYRRGLEEEGSKDDRTISMTKGSGTNRLFWTPSQNVARLPSPTADEDSMCARKNRTMEAEEPASNDGSTPMSKRPVPRVGAQAIRGVSGRSQDVETGSIVVGEGGTIQATPVADDGLEERIREEVEAEMLYELQA